MWRLPCLRRRILPVPVTLKRLATDDLVLDLQALRAMGAAFYGSPDRMQDFCCLIVILREACAILRQGFEAGPAVAEFRS